MEANFDGLVGPTHLFGGLSPGNVASTEHKGWISHPQAAALEGLEKMWRIAQLGIPQGIFPPHERPHLPTLRSFGFQGSDERVLSQAAREAPFLLLACSSASPMWLANAATGLPSCDTDDQRVHFSVASLRTNLHRSIEPPFTWTLLQTLFPNPLYFVHHPPMLLPDEGAANHVRFCKNYESAGLHLFIYGGSLSDGKIRPHRFPVRQVREASEAIARRAGLDPERVVFAQQNPDVIDAGVFHNDLISFGNQRLFACYEHAFLHTKQILDELERKASMAGIDPFEILVITEKQIPLSQIIESYLCNSQLLTNKTGYMVLLAPQECRKFPKVVEWIHEKLIQGPTPVKEVVYIPLHESMKNGGGPGCLRMPIVLTEEERGAVHPGIWLTQERYEILKTWIHQHYRQRLHAQDLADPQLLKESREALDQLCQILELPTIYTFQ